MENNYQQKINCTVHTCKYNDTQYQKCTLQQIIVEPTQNCNTQQADESMCGSYLNKQKEQQQFQQQ